MTEAIQVWSEHLYYVTTVALITDWLLTMASLMGIPSKIFRST